MKIEHIRGRQVFDSRGNPTIEVDVQLDSGAKGRAIVPSGASVGVHEAIEIRDNNPGKFLGRSVYRAVDNVNNILNGKLKGFNANSQRELDQFMIEIDGTEHKSSIGANAILGVSLATAQAMANGLNIPLYSYLGGANANVLPMPMIQMIGGGIHAGNATEVQDFLIIPVSATTFSEAMEIAFNVYNSTKKIFQDRKIPVAVSDEGGFWPQFDSNETPLSLLTKAIESAGYIPLKDVSIALDIASSHFYSDGIYKLSSEQKEMNASQFIDLQENWIKKYPIISLEDSCAEDDWASWAQLTSRLGNKVQLIGDDLFTTDIKRIRKGVENKVGNAVLIKMNQIGTLTETLDAIDITRKAGYRPVISARSGETEDTTMVHLCVATNAGQIKVGSMARSERLAKYNELLRIEEDLGARGSFANPFKSGFL
ncbi:MAG TPA: phosphopyruvate hydratase [Hanamia sp.]|nr:phosphopyruvate hydratase [Hanamia sp.]